MFDTNYDTLDKEVQSFLTNLLPYGSLDLYTCVKTLKEAEVEFDKFSEYVEEYCKDTGANLLKLDICAIAYDYLLQEARREIEEKIGVDILNDLSNEVYVIGNYCCTQFDSKDYTPTIKTIELIANDERSPLLDWFFSQIDE